MHCCPRNLAANDAACNNAHADACMASYIAACIVACVAAYSVAHSAAYDACIVQSVHHCLRVASCICVYIIAYYAG